MRGLFANIDKELSMILFKVISVVLALETVAANLEEKNKDKWGHLMKIPRKFEVRGDNAKSEFKRIVNDIQDLTAGKNMTILYKVKVEVVNPELNKMNKKKKIYKTIKTKKYSVPLKKQNMKLSNFEVLLRKLAENGPKGHSVAAASFTTNKPSIYFLTTKQIQLKYKPIVSRIKTNYTKVIRPVRNKIETIDV